MTNEQMEFPKTWEEYEQEYGFNDFKEVYTNNSRLIPSFRVKQWLDHLPQPWEDEWTIKQYQVPIENKQIPTIPGTALSKEPTACKIVCTYTHSACKSEEYLNKYKFCPNCGVKMKGGKGNDIRRKRTLYRN